MIVPSHVYREGPQGRFSRTHQRLGEGKFKQVFKGFDEHRGVDIAWHKLFLDQFYLDPEQTTFLSEEVA